MSTFSPDLRIELITTGDQAGTWGTTTNTNLGTIIESAIAGYTTVAVASADQAFTALDGAADEARNAMIRLTTSTGAPFAVYAPPSSKQYIIWNNSGYTATIYNSTVLGNTTAAGSGVAIADGDRVVVFSDGTSFYPIKASGVTSTVPIANGGTGQTTQQAAINALAGAVTSGSYLRGNGTNVVMAAIQAADVPTLNQNTTGSAGSATNIAGGAVNQIPAQSGAGATTFIAAPTVASTYLSWTGSAFSWTNIAPGSTFATDITVNTLTVGKGPSNPVGTTTFGYQAGAAATANNTNQTAIGYRALASATTSAGVGLDFDGSTAVGYRALELANPTVSGANTAVGAAALRNLTNGLYNTGVGAGAGQSLGAGLGVSGSTYVGALAGNSATTGSGTAVGYAALRNTTDRATGSTAIGHSALFEASTYSGNSSIFNQYNTAVGYQALQNLSAENSTLAGSNNTSLGYFAGRNLLSGSNNLLLGNNAQASTTSISNEITLGNSSITTLRCQVTSITSLSDQRDKYAVEDLPLGLNLINALRPRRYKWDKRDWYFDEIETVQEDGTIETETVPVPKDGSRAQTDWNEGFVAQEAKAALQSLGADWFPLVYETNPEKLEMSAGKLIPVLVKAVQELTARLEALEAK